MKTPSPGFAMISVLLCLWHMSHLLLRLQHKVWQQRTLQQALEHAIKAEQGLSYVQRQWLAHQGCHHSPDVATCHTQWHGVSVQCAIQSIGHGHWLITWDADYAGVSRRQKQLWHC